MRVAVDTHEVQAHRGRTGGACGDRHRSDAEPSTTRSWCGRDWRCLARAPDPGLDGRGGRSRELAISCGQEEQVPFLQGGETCARRGGCGMASVKRNVDLPRRVAHTRRRGHKAFEYRSEGLAADHEVGTVRTGRIVLRDRRNVAHRGVGAQATRFESAATRRHAVTSVERRRRLGFR